MGDCAINIDYRILLTRKAMRPGDGQKLAEVANRDRKHR